MANPNKVGLMFAALLGGWYVCWALLVLVGWAQRIIDFIFWAHMIQPVYIIKRFDFAAAVTLIVLTTATGYLFGFMGGLVWNRLHRS